MDKNAELVHVTPGDDFLKDESKRYICCPLDDCGTILPRSSDLRKHLHSTHIPAHFKKILPYSRASEAFVFHCPEYCCYYHDPAARYFTSLKFLKQHFKKVHAEKKYQCTKCGLLFGMDCLRKRHEDRCGEIFACQSCPATYAQIESLLTHCKRNKHTPPEECLSKKRREKDKENKTKDGAGTKSKETSETENTVKEINKPVGIVIVVPDSVLNMAKTMAFSSPHVSIHPKPVVLPLMSACTPEIAIEASGSTSFCEQGENASTQNCLAVDSVGVQTYHSLGSRKSNCKLTSVRESECQTQDRQSSTGIQTLMTCVPKRRVKRTIVGTQTPGDLILKTAMASADIPIAMESRACQISPGYHRNSTHTSSSETQTYDHQTPKKPKKKRLMEKKTLAGRMSVGAQTSSSFRKRKSNRKSQNAVEVVDFHCNPLPDNSMTAESYVPFLTNECYSKLKSSILDKDSQGASIPLVSDIANNLYTAQTQTEILHPQRAFIEDAGENSILTNTLASTFSTENNYEGPVEKADYLQIKQKDVNKTFKTSSRAGTDNLHCQSYCSAGTQYETCNLFTDFVNSSQINFDGNKNVTSLNNVHSTEPQTRTILDISRPEHLSVSVQTHISDLNFQRNFQNPEKMQYRVQAAQQGTKCTSAVNSTDGHLFSSWTNSLSNEQSNVPSHILVSSSDNALSKEGKADFECGDYSSRMFAPEEPYLLGTELSVSGNSHHRRSPWAQTSPGGAVVMPSPAIINSDTPEKLFVNNTKSQGVQTVDAGKPNSTSECSLNQDFMPWQGTNVPVLPTNDPVINDPKSKSMQTACDNGNSLPLYVPEDPSLLWDNSSLNTGRQLTKRESLIAVSQTSPLTSVKSRKDDSEYGVHDNLISSITMMDSEVQTSDLNPFISCNPSTSTTAITTQTESVDDIFDLFMNNMETQTAEDSFLCNMELTDIETQTNLDLDALEKTQISTETQTNNTPNRQDQQCSVVELTDMQTQTHFSQLGFDDIYLTDSHTQTTFWPKPTFC